MRMIHEAAEAASRAFDAYRFRRTLISLVSIAETAKEPWRRNMACSAAFQKIEHIVKGIK